MTKKYFQCFRAYAPARLMVFYMCLHKAGLKTFFVMPNPAGFVGFIKLQFCGFFPMDKWVALIKYGQY